MLLPEDNLSSNDPFGGAQFERTISSISSDCTIAVARSVLPCAAEEEHSTRPNAYHHKKDGYHLKKASSRLRISFRLSRSFGRDENFKLVLRVKGGCLISADNCRLSKDQRVYSVSAANGFDSASMPR